MRFCEQCHVGLVRKIRKDGSPEPMVNFDGRKYCDHVCAGEARRGRPQVSAPPSKCSEVPGAAWARRKW